MFDELEGVTLGVGNGVGITVLRHVRNNFLTETVGEIETMSVRRECACVGLEFFI